MKISFEQWRAAFRDLNRLTDITEKERQEQLGRLLDSAKTGSFTTDQMLFFEDSLKHYRDLKNSLDTAREGGREEGREKEREDIARKMRAAGLPPATISAVTGLSEAQIAALK